MKKSLFQLALKTHFSMAKCTQCVTSTYIYEIEVVPSTYLCHVIEQGIPIMISNDLHQNFYHRQNFHTHLPTSYPTQIHHTFLKKYSKINYLIFFFKLNRKQTISVIITMDNFWHWNSEKSIAFCI